MKRTLICLLSLLLAGLTAVAQEPATGTKRTATLSPAAIKKAGAIKKISRPADAICGVYLMCNPKNENDKIKLQVTRTADGTYQGMILSVEPATNSDGSVRTDIHNKDKKLRHRKADEVMLCWGLKYDSKEKMWVEGTLYDPTTGNNFGLQLKQSANGKDLEARYYKGRPVFGITQTWKRTTP